MKDISMATLVENKQSFSCLIETILASKNTPIIVIGCLGTVGVVTTGALIGLKELMKHGYTIMATKSSFTLSQHAE